MLSPRAPLFSVSLAFATGCLLGLDGILHLPVALIVLAVTGLIWFVLARREKASLFVFYVFAACAGMAHTLLVATAIAPDDLRRLPKEKSIETTQWRGLIIEEPQSQLSTRTTRGKPDRTTFVLRVEAWRPTGGRLFGDYPEVPWQQANGDIRCTLTGPADELQCGDRLIFAAPLMPVPPALCPGELDYRAWEAAHGIYYHVTIPAANWQRTETDGGNWWQKLSFQARDWAYGRLQIGLEDDPRMADFMAGMLIGYRQQIPLDIEQDFRRTGTLHVFAVSGQNIAEMLVVVMVALQLCGFVRWRWAWTVAPIVLLYCLLTGSPSSAVRATVMVLAILCAWRLGRPLNALGCWSLAFLAMLVWNPAILLDPGAQLSFGVVLGLILIGAPLMRQIKRPFTPDAFLPRDLLTSGQRMEEKFWWWGSALLAASIAAALVSEPITALNFHQVTPISVLANLVVVPVAGLITMVGTLSVTASLVCTPLTVLLNNANWLLARCLIWFVGLLAHSPGASINVPDLRVAAAPTPSFIVAPVQDSACLFVRGDGGDWLVNSGRESSARSATSKMLQFYGVNRLDGLVLAQISVADNSGAEIIIRDFQPQRLIIPALSTRSTVEKSLNDFAVYMGGKIEPWKRGVAVDLAPGVSVEVLHPAEDSAATRAEDRALTLLFHAGDRTLLWAGKIGPKAQADLLAAYPGLHADVLVMGTEPPPGREWLQALGVGQWLQIPRRDQRLNATGDAVDVSDFCQVWPLDKTGAVDLHFQAASGDQPAGIILRPWLACP